MRLFLGTWERVPARIAVHASTENEAKSVAAEYLMAMIKIEQVDFCDADILLPAEADQLCRENV